MLPPLSSMHLVNCCVAAWQLLPHCCCCWVAWACTGCGAGSDEPPEKRPPMAWPTDEPMATPLRTKSACYPPPFCLFKFLMGMRESESSLLGATLTTLALGRILFPGRGHTYAAVLAIWPNSPGPCEAAGAGAICWGACWGGAAMVVAGRCC